MKTSIEEIVRYYPEISGIHTACLAVPEIGEDDQIALEKDIAERGLLDDIVLTKDGELLDGRNRLIACWKASVEPRFIKTTADPFEFAHAKNIARRHLEPIEKCIFGEAWAAYEKAKAKERYDANVGRPSKEDKLVETFPQIKEPRSRDAIGARVGVSGRTYEKFEQAKEHAPAQVVEQMLKKEISIDAAYQAAREVKQQKESQPVEKPQKKASESQTLIITASGKESFIALPQKVVFNQTNDSVDWASWTWNPVTGCEHGCKFCYAREIANSERMLPYYPNKFEPTFHPYRLNAPKNTSRPKSEDPRDGRVFVCSMADLFGKWVPDAWIKSVFRSCIESPEWEYLFLTKWPARYSKMPLIEKAWYGASIIQQSDVKRVESDMQKIESDSVVKWISLEPMLGPIKFHDISWCDLVVVGSQTSTTQPEGFVPAFSPQFEWVYEVVEQCKQFCVPYYLKENLLTQPGMKLTKGLPR
jgi:protein gp37